MIRQQWGGGLVQSSSDWIDLRSRLGDRLAQHVLGARPGEVTVVDSTSVNLYKLAAAALDARPGTIVLDTGDFPTDRYVPQGLAEARDTGSARCPPTPDAGLDPTSCARRWTTTSRQAASTAANPSARPEATRRRPVTAPGPLLVSPAH